MNLKRAQRERRNEVENKLKSAELLEFHQKKSDKGILSWCTLSQAKF
jgi:hypothetical protein